VWASFGPEPVGGSVEELLGQVVVAPDGCTLDAEGHIWVADGFSSRVLRIASGGAIVDEIAAPGGMGVYACALGGDDGRELLMCCAPDFYEHTRAPVREAVLVSTQVAVPHAGLP
jgi:sugar lactone lactonase YvrE